MALKTTIENIALEVIQNGGENFSVKRIMEIMQNSYKLGLITIPIENNKLPIISPTTILVIEYLEEIFKKYIYNLKFHLIKDESIMDFYVKEWKLYKNISQKISALFSQQNHQMYMSASLVGRGQASNIYELAMYCWKESLDKARNHIYNVILEQIEKERNGLSVASNLVREIIYSFLDIGYREKGELSQNKYFDIYHKEFEKLFLEKTHIYYSKESSKFLEKNPVVEYMKGVESRLVEEAARAKQYLHESTHDSLINLCRDVLIKCNEEKLKNTFLDLLKDARHEDMGRLYNLLNQIDDNFIDLRKTFENYVNTQGQEAIAAIQENGASNPELYVTTLLDVYWKYKTIVVKSFKNDIEFNSVLSKAFKSFINRNAITIKYNSSGKSSELLVKYCDGLLKKNARSLEELDLEEAFNNVMIIFKYIDDSDVFLQNYARLLNKRLLMNNSSSNDAESGMISRLKEECGNSYTTKLQNLFNDDNLSKDLTLNFKKLYGDVLSYEFNAHVISCVNWPSTVPKISFCLLPELMAAKQRFEEFYRVQYKGRKLQWLYHASRGELVTTCYKNRYTLHTSTYQMAILLLFNTTDVMTVQELADQTQCEREMLIQVVQTLLKTKLFKSDHDDKLTGDSKIIFNPNYKNKKLKLNINVPLKLENKLDEMDSSKKIQNERIYHIEASIVRIMKSRKTLSHNQLTSEVLEDLKKWFKADPRVVKKVIEKLIDKDYLKRSNFDLNSYEYLA